MIDIIVPTLNRHEAIERLIKDLGNQTSKDFNLYVVDQSNKPFKNKLKPPFKVITLWRPDFKSPILARDYGSKIAKSEILIFLDDDMIPKKDLIENVKNIFEKYDGPIVIGGICNIREYGRTETLIKKIFHRGIFNDPRIYYFRNAFKGNFHLLNSFLPTFYISAGIMAMNKSALKINPFPTHFKKHILGGDIYFGLSCVKKNVPVYLSYLLSATEVEDEKFNFKSIKSWKKISLSFHSAYHLLKLAGINPINLFHFFLRSFLICLYSINLLRKNLTSNI